MGGVVSGPVEESTVARLAQTARLLAEQFQPAMEPLREAVLRGGILARPFGRRNTKELVLLLLELQVPTRPRQDFAVFRENRVDQTAPQTPAPPIAAAVVRQVADTPLLHRLRRK